MADLSRSPRISCILASKAVNNIIHAEWSVVGVSRSATCHLTISTIDDATNGNWLLSTPSPVTIQIIFYAANGGEKVCVFMGIIDQVVVQPLKRVLTVRGRDYSCLLMDTPLHSSFLNQTSSEIASSVAERHGLIGRITATTALVGAYSGDNHNKIILEAHSSVTTEWDILRSLANQEGFQFYIKKDTLIFLSPSDRTPAHHMLTEIDIQDVTIFRDVSEEGESTAIVKSWNTWDAKKYSNEISTTPAPQDSLESPMVQVAPRSVIFIHPNLANSRVISLSQRLQAAISTQRLTIYVSMLGNTNIDPQDMISIPGSYSTITQNYRIESIRYQFSASAGFIMRIRASANFS